MVEWLERRQLLTGNSSISGLAWNDQNGNGAKDATETVAVGVVVFLDANDNGTRDAGETSMTTAADGTYSFTLLDPGNYVVREEVPASNARTFPTLSGARLFTTNTSPSPDVIVELNPSTSAAINTFNAPVASGSSTTGLAFDGQTLYFLSNTDDTLYRLNPNTGAVLGSTVLASGTYGGLAAVGGFLYALDSSADDVFKINPATGAVVATLDINGLNSGVNLVDALGEAPATGELLGVTSDGVVFINPATGLVTHGLGVPDGSSVRSLTSVGDEIFAGYSSTPRIDVYPRDSAILSRSMTTTFSPVSLGGWGDASGAHRVTLAAAQAATGINFGNRVGVAGISGTIWDDFNGNGVRESGEPPLPGQTVYLDANDNHTRDAGEPTATTAADGSYAFPGLAAGNYVVRDETPTNYALSSPRSAGLFAFDTSPSSPEADRIVELNRLTGEVLRTFNAPVPSGSTTAGLAFDGQTLFYVSDSTDRLYRLNPNTGEQLGAPAQLASKTYGGLAAMGGFVYALDSIGDDIFKLNPATGAVLATIHVSGVIDALGEVPSTGELVSANSTGLVFINSTTGAVTRSIPLASATSIKALTSVGDEIYVGYNTTPNRVDVLDQSGVVQRSLTPSPLAVAGLGGWSDPTTGYHVSLATGQAFVADFGNQFLQSRLLGTLWDDLDGDGVRDSGEPPRAGVVVYLDADNDGVLDAGERNSITAADGAYSFVDVPAGSVVVRQVGPVSLSQSFPALIKDRLFSTDMFDSPDRIWELDPVTGAALNTYIAPLPSGQIFVGLAFDGRTLYFLSFLDDILYEVNPDTGVVLDSTLLPDGGYDGLAVLNGLIYAKDGNSKIVVFDPVSDRILRSFTLTGFSTGFLDDGLGEITGPDRLLASSISDEVLEIDPATGVTTISFIDPSGLSQRGMTSIGQQVLMGDTNGRINFYSRTGTLLRSLVGTPPVFGLGSGKSRTDGAYHVDLQVGETIPLLDFANRQNLAPTNITLSFNSIPENVGVIGRVNVADPDSGELFTYTVSNPRFDVINDQLVMKPGQSANFEAETSLSLTVIATDTGGQQVSQAFVLNVTNVDEPPTDITLSAANIAENAVAAVIGNVVAIGDPEGDAQTFTVSDSRFEILSGQLKLKAGQSLNFETTPSVSLTITASDAGGAQFAKQFTITVTNVNEAPTNITLSASTVAENAVAAAIGTATVTDPDVGDTRTLSVNDSRFEFVGTQLKLKTGLSVNFEAEPTISLMITATDAGGLQFSKSFTITVTNVNEAPSDISLVGSSVAENAVAAVIGAIAVTDPDAGNTHTFTLSDSRFEIVGGQLKLKAGQSLNFEAEPSVSLMVTAQDQGGLQFSKPFTLTVTNVNEQPTNITLASSSVAENAVGAIVGAVTVTDPDAGDTHSFLIGGDSRFEIVGGQLRLVAGQSLNFEAEPSVTLMIAAQDAGGLLFSKSFTVTVTNINEAPASVSLTGSAIAENAAGAVVGAVTATDPDAGDSLMLSVSDSRFEIVAGQLQLKTGQSVDFEAEPSVNLMITAQDLGGLQLAQPFTVTVTNANEPPTNIALSGSSLAENAAGATVGNVTVTDPDAGDSHTFSVGDNRFEIVGGQLRLKAGQSLDFEAEPSVNLTITAQDVGGLQFSKPFTLTVTDMNEAPASVSLAGSPIAENVAGAVVGTVTATDSDAGDSLMLSVSDSRFEIVAGQLQLKAGQSVDFEAEPSINLTITAQDLGGLQLTKPFVVTVANVNESPTNIALSNSSVAENAAGMVVGNLTVTDPDAGDSHTFSVTDSRFEIVANQLRLKAGQSLDYETEPSINLTITAQDVGGLQLTRPFTVTVTNVNEAPDHISVNASLPENAAGAIVGVVTATDPDAVDALTLSVSDNRFEVVANQLRLKAGQSLDFEAEPSVNLTITAQDAGGLQLSQPFTLTVTNVNESPTDVSLTGSGIAENALGATVGMLSAADPDAGDSFTYSVSDSRFEVVGNQLQLKAGQSLDFEAEPSVNLTITAQDAGGLQLAQPFTLAVTNVNEAPTDIMLVSGAVYENAAGAIFGTVFGSDPDAGDSLTYLTSDSRIEIVSNSLRLKAGQSLDFETEPSVSLTITVLDAHGLQFSKPFTLAVKNVNEAPTNIGLTALTVSESSPGAVVGDVVVLDVDAGDSHTITPSDSRFEVSAGQLRLKAGVSLNFQTEPTVPLDLTAQDAGGLSLTKSFTLTVTTTNHQPTGIDVSNHSVLELLSGESVGTLTATDPDAGQTLAFAVDDPRFEVVGSVLKLKDAEFLDRSLGLAVSLVVTATDNGTPPRSASQTIVLDVLANQYPWQNALHPLDTNNDEPDHFVVGLDALIVFNLLNNPGTLLDANGRLPAARPSGSELPFYDTSGDGFCTSLDALLIFNELNSRPSGEGEASPLAAESVRSGSAVPTDLDLVLAAIAEDIALVARPGARRPVNVAR